MSDQTVTPSTATSTATAEPISAPAVDAGKPASSPPMFVSLHNHSVFSLLDGLQTPIQLAASAKRMGMPAVALTDHGTCAGWFAFDEACKSVRLCQVCHAIVEKDKDVCKCGGAPGKKGGVKPIFGTEAYLVNDINLREKGEDRWHLTLWAKNKEGLANLRQLSTKSFAEGFYGKPRIDFRLLKMHSSGLMAGSACAVGVVCGPILDGKVELAKANAGRIRDIFGDDFYIEIMTHRMDDQRCTNPSCNFRETVPTHTRCPKCGGAVTTMTKVVRKAMVECYQIAKEMGIKSIWTTDSHYNLREDALSHDVLLSIQTKDTIKNPNRFTFSSDDFYFKSPEEAAKIVTKSLDLLSNTLELANKVESNLMEETKDTLPPYELPAGFTREIDYLRQLVMDGMRERGLLGKPEYEERMNHELAVIEKVGYAKYFLILRDLIGYAHRQNFRVGPGRGSGVASLCLYCLRVTALDPIRYKLMFSRFLNADRISPPDVDVDFDNSKQEKIIEYAAQRYGHDCVARISTYGSMRARDAVKRAAKALDIGGDWELAEDHGGEWKSGPKTLREVNDIAVCIEDDPKATIESSLKNSDTLRMYEKKYPDLFRIAKSIEGTLSSASVHAAGIVICKEPVVNYVPLRMNNGVAMTQFTMTEVEKLGLLKFDILALKTMATIEKALEWIRLRHGKDLDLNTLDPDSPESKPVFEMLNKKQADGVFQFERDAARQLLADVHVDSFEDIVVVNALNRPGTLYAKVDVGGDVVNGVHNLYMDYKHGRRQIEYVHPKMKEILQDTYGMMCFAKDQPVYGTNGPLKIHCDSGKVYWLDDGGRVVSTTPKSQFRTGKRQAYRYTFSNGYSTVCTPDHMFQMHDGSYKKIDDVFQNKMVIPFRVGTVRGGQSLEYDCLRAYLFGALIGDGNTNASSPLFCAGKSQTYAHAIASVFINVFYRDGNRPMPKVFFSTRCWYTRLGFDGAKRSPLVSELKEMGLRCHGNNKRIPFSKFKQERQVFLALVAGLVDTDGCICSDVHFSSASEWLLEDFTYLMWRLGYHTYRCGHSIHVCESAQLFGEIHPYLIHKKDSDRPCVCGLKMTVPVDYAIDLIKSRQNGMSQRAFCMKHGINRSTYRRIMRRDLAMCEIQSLGDLVSVDSASSFASLMVVKKENVGEIDVYDIEMPELTSHNFFIAPGVVVHNCYQEDVINVAISLAGYTPSEADKLRKACGKKVAAIMDSERKHFVEGCVKNDVDEASANKVFDLIALFAGYGFNRSHSAAYAYIAYQTAYLKYYYPKEFYAALLSTEKDDTKRERFERSAAGFAKTKILPPDISFAKLEYIIEDDGIRRPLTAVGGVGEAAAVEIVKRQSYKDLGTFAQRMSGVRAVSSRIITALAEAGAMDRFGIRRESILAEYEKYRDRGKASVKHRMKYGEPDGSLLDES